MNEATALLIRHYSEQLLTIPTKGIVFDWITHKVRHTYAVLDVAQRIMDMEGFVDKFGREFTKRVEMATLLHDIGRFYQHNGERILTNSEYPHGNYGMDILLSEGIIDPVVLLGVKYHDKLDLSGIETEFTLIEANREERMEILTAVRLVRDADKVQNILYCLYDKGEVFRRLDSLEGAEGLNKNVLDSFLKGDLVDNRMAVSSSDKILNMWSWVADINFESSMELLGNDFNKRMLDLIELSGCSPEDLQKLKKHFDYSLT